MDYDEKQLLPIGTMLQHGKYRVERHLASGGFGNTYIVLNTGFSRKFVLKEFYMQGINQREKDQTTVSVSNEMNNALFSSQLEKFEKEAKRIIDLYNPHIIRVHDLFRENETAYYVMDYVDGKSLSEIMNQNGSPMKEGEVWGLMPQLFDALSAAHKKDILHLDIKPGNILMDAEGKVVLIDFGASKQVNINGKDTYSTSTAMCYTPGFAPSEQIDKRMQHLGAWTDIYALGATLYNLLTLQCPPLPSEISDEKENAFLFPEEVSPQMRQLIIWMMQIGRKDRPQSIDEIKARINSEPNHSDAPTTEIKTDTEKTRKVPSFVEVQKTVPSVDEITKPVGAKEAQTQKINNALTAYKEPMFIRVAGFLIASLGLLEGICAMFFCQKNDMEDLWIVLVSSTLLLVSAGLTTYMNKKISIWLLISATLLPNVFFIIFGDEKAWRFSVFFTFILFVVLLAKLIVLKNRLNPFLAEGKQSFVQQIKNNNPVVLIAFAFFILFAFGWVWYNGFDIYSLTRRGFIAFPDIYLCAMLSVGFQFLVLFILLSRVVILHRRAGWLLGGWFVIWAIYSYSFKTYITAGTSDIDHMVPLIIALFMFLAVLFLPKGVIANWKTMRSDILDSTAINMLMIYAVIGIITCFCFSLLNIQFSTNINF